MSEHKDFTIESLANYLHLLPTQITRLADRGKLPGRKVSGEWRFSPAEIHHWMEARMGILDDDELAHVEGVLQRAVSSESTQPLSVAAMLPMDAIAVSLEARTRTKVITAITQLAAATGRLWDPVRMAEAVRSREDMQPTALDIGVALLHPRRPIPAILDGDFLAFGRTAAGIPFGSRRGVLTDLFFLICSVDDRRHLQTLARLSRLLGDDQFVVGIRHAADAAEVLELISEKEAEFDNYDAND